MENCTDCERQPTKITGVCPVFNMSDGRHFTNYSSRCMQNDSLSKTGKVMNTYEYRMYLQKNAESLMKNQSEVALNQNMCSPCYDLDEPGTMLPATNSFQCNGNTCSLNSGDPNGIGTDRNYNVMSNEVLRGSEILNGNNNGILAESYLNFNRNK
tara:strand:- start:1128 stop:1592 length:465 start_codon:yes stop_codon:yes gene_type:complete